MNEWDDSSLLREYAEHNSEAAFGVLVARHLNKVYSVALRQTGNAHAAEEITQAVFVILARKSRQLDQRVILSGWLYQTARLAAVTFIRSQVRRARREQEAQLQTNVNEATDRDWMLIAPLLETAMAGLSKTDRHAVVLRYFDNKSIGEVATALGANEEAARRRVSRAVEKLRRFFVKRGIVLPAAALAAMIAANATQAAPATLAVSVTDLAAAQGATATGSTLALVHGSLKLMNWFKFKLAAGTAMALIMAGILVLSVFFKPIPPAPPGPNSVADVLEHSPLISRMRFEMTRFEPVHQHVLPTRASTNSIEVALGPSRAYEAGWIGNDFYYHDPVGNRLSGREGNWYWQMPYSNIVIKTWVEPGTPPRAEAMSSVDDLDQLAEVLNLGIKDLAPETLHWDGDTFTGHHLHHIFMTSKQAGSLRSSLMYGHLNRRHGVVTGITIHEGFPDGQKYILQFQYDDHARLPFGIPNVITRTLYFGTNLVLEKKITFLDVQPADSHQPKLACTLSQQPYHTGEYMQVFSNNDNYVVRGDGSQELVELKPPYAGIFHPTDNQTLPRFSPGSLPSAK